MLKQTDTGYSMKAIILAAGCGSRMGSLTSSRPKCMVEIEGKSLLDFQLASLRSAGISDITVVRGFNGSKINSQGVSYIENSNWATTNMVASLMCAEQTLCNQGDFLVCYGDIIYEPRLVKNIMSSKGDICVLADKDWQGYWQQRMNNWLDDIESFKYDSQGILYEIGRPRCLPEDSMARYVGILKFSRAGFGWFRQAFYELSESLQSSKSKWRNSSSFKNAYMTCFLQELIDRKKEIRAVLDSHGWMEFDAPEDIILATKWIKEKNPAFMDLGSFYD